MIFDGSEAEVCEECAFDSRQWHRQDAVDLFDSLGSRWRDVTLGIDDGELNRRPRPLTWSALEYGLHSAFVIAILRDAIERILAADGCHAPDLCPEVDTEDNTQPLVLARFAILDALEREGRALALVVAATNEGWGHRGSFADTSTWQAEATLLHAVHDTTHHLKDVERGLIALGASHPENLF